MIVPQMMRSLSEVHNDQLNIIKHGYREAKLKAQLFTALGTAALRASGRVAKAAV
jgi:hypothetical protein